MRLSLSFTSGNAMKPLLNSPRSRLGLLGVCLCLALAAHAAKADLPQHRLSAELVWDPPYAGDPLRVAVMLTSPAQTAEAFRQLQQRERRTVECSSNLAQWTPLLTNYRTTNWTYAPIAPATAKPLLPRLLGALTSNQPCWHGRQLVPPRSSCRPHAPTRRLQHSSTTFPLGPSNQILSPSVCLPASPRHADSYGRSGHCPNAPGRRSA
jgi:hypothetical protein